MGRPPLSSLFTPITCYPDWYARYLPFADGTARIASGCATVNGNVQCDPKLMAKAAGQRIGQEVSLEAYTLARYLSSEVGNGSLAEKVCVAQNAINRVRYAEPRTRTLTNLLLYRQAAGHPNRGFYGPIHQGTDAPYGRWAATSRDPSVGDVLIALGVLSGDIDPWYSKGADDQLGPKALKAHGYDPVLSVHNHGLNRRQYWVGPIYGVDPWQTFQYRTMPEVDPRSPIGQALIDRGVAAMRSSSPSWTGLEPCASSYGLKLGLVAAASLAVGVVGAVIFWRQRYPEGHAVPALSAPSPSP